MTIFTSRTLKKCLLIIIACSLLPIITSAASVQIINNQPSGPNTSLVLDANGFPVMAYLASNSETLNVLRCNDPNCVGGDDSNITVLAGPYRNMVMALDANGFPIIASLVFPGPDLVLIHCNDLNCAGGDESVETVDNGGRFLSMVLDAAGNPVIAHTPDNLDLKLVRCNDPNCAGGDESIEFVNTFGSTAHTSLALDANGFPVIAHADSLTNLHVTSCNDPNCAGGDENSEVVYATTIEINRTALSLDANGFPVVAYSDERIGMRLLHCTDALCSGANTNPLIVAGENLGVNGVSMQLNGELPVIAYTQDSTFSERDYALVIIECNDVNCLGNDETVLIYDEGSLNNFAFGINAMQLDSNACPNIVYGVNNNFVKFANCSGDPIYDSEPATGNIVQLEGEAGTVAFRGIAVENVGADGTQLNVSVDDITTGYSVSAALPFTNLSPTDNAINFRVLCTVGSSPATGTLSLTTNDPLRPTVGYPLSCGASGTVSNPSDTSSNSEPPVPDFLQQVTELPSTGETPAWRDWLWIVSLILGGIGILLLLPIRQTKQS